MQPNLLRCCGPPKMNRIREKILESKSISNQIQNSRIRIFSQTKFFAIVKFYFPPVGTSAKNKMHFQILRPYYTSFSLFKSTHWFSISHTKCLSIHIFLRLASLSTTNRIFKFYNILPNFHPSTLYT